MKTNKTLLWVGIGSALLIGGGLFWWFKNKPKTDEKDDTEKEPVKDEDKSKQEEAVIKNETNSTAPSLPSTPFKNKAEGNAFRAWMSVNHSDFRYKGDVLDKSGDYDNSFMRVAYDKYGKFLTQISPKSYGWDGTFNGNPLPSSDYWFIIEFIDDNQTQQFKAHFSLKR
jgi:gliding motility-associated-like protein